MNVGDEVPGGFSRRRYLADGRELPPTSCMGLKLSPGTPHPSTKLTQPRVSVENLITDIHRRRNTEGARAYAKRLASWVLLCYAADECR